MSFGSNVRSIRFVKQLGKLAILGQFACLNPRKSSDSQLDGISYVNDITENTYHLTMLSRCYSHHK